MTALRSARCVVTGATGGIGDAIARALVDEGAHVLALGRNGAKLDALAASAPRDAATPVVVDLADAVAIVRAAREVVHAGALHVLVHAAGVIQLGSTAELTADDLDHLYAVNLRAPYDLTRQLLPALKRERGQVVFVNSSAALRPSPLNALYASTKAGLKALAEGIRDDVNEDGVRVLTVYAGRTATTMQETVHEFEGRTWDAAYLMTPEDIATSVVHCLSLPRTAEVTDIAMRPMRKAPSS
jgi:NADP-dependent 3-hydroxy acid dehydrogenase YdfG